MIKRGNYINMVPQINRELIDRILKKKPFKKLNSSKSSSSSLQPATKKELVAHNESKIHLREGDIPTEVIVSESKRSNLTDELTDEDIMNLLKERGYEGTLKFSKIIYITI
jgi:hypothetical protein